MKVIILLLSTLFLVSPARAAGFDHSIWGKLLQEHIRVMGSGMASQVDYTGLAIKRALLKEYLNKLSGVTKEDFDVWSNDEQLAFLLNAYNSWTVELVLTGYPEITSIKELGSVFQSPWEKRFISLLGEKQSLDEIEHGLIRGSGRYNDFRIHFAANCASIGCPALRVEPYRGSELQHQLEEAMRFFLMDRSRNRLDGQVLQVSSIFKWYRKDFEQGWLSIGSLLQFFANQAEALELTKDQTQQILDGKIKIEFLDYDWKLNSVP